MIEPRLSFSITDINEPFDILQQLGTKVVGIEQNITELSQIPQNDTIQLFSRITLTENKEVNQQTIKQLLQKNRHKHHFIVVEPTSSGLAAIAARDGRVDAIRISPNSTLKVFNTRYGRRLEEANKIIELDISCMFVRNLAKQLRPLSRIISAMAKCNINFLLSINPQKIMDLRSYRGVQSLGRLIGLSNERTSPHSLLERLEQNQKKLDGKIPFPGVEVD
ncbi:MAG: RNase P subunit p30 family protein [Candidatus Kariarchaeaceae archaeon]|jgi:RNase P/RNase MRP subunit p30